MKEIIKHIINGKNFCAVEHYGDDVQEKLVLVATRLKNGELEITSTQVADTIELIVPSLEKKGKVHLILNNHQVLQKTVAYKNESAQALVYNSYPSIDFKDFYYEVCPFGDTATLFICRKSIIDDVINQYRKLDITITSWSLGFLSINEVLPYTEAAINEIYTSSLLLSLQNTQIMSAVVTNTYDNHTYNIGGENILGEYLIAFGGVLRAYQNDDLSTISNFQNDSNHQDKLFKQYRLFQKGLPLALGTLLLVFLINFLCYNYYYTEVDRLQQVAQVNNTQRVLLVQKDSIVSQKKKRFDDVISSASSSVSLYIDEMILSLPKSIVLNSLVYQPITRKIRANKEIKYENNIIEITGTTKVVDDISSWISEIEQLPFVENSFLDIKSEGGNRSFELKLELVAL